MSNQPSSGPTKRARRTFALLVVVFFAPVVLGWLVYQNAEQWAPKSTTNYGELVTPPRLLDEFGLRQLDGQPLGLDHLQGKWTLVYIGSSDCTVSCRDNLYKMRQVRLAMGEDMPRVQRLFVLTGTEGLDDLHAVLKDYPGMIVASADAATLQEFIDQFELPGAGAAHDAQWVYVVDPLGNLMMTYPADAAPKGMLKDLERLLRISQIG